MIAALAALPTAAYFANVGRGATVDTDALVAALRSGQLAGAGLDVTELEPLPRGHALWTLPNVIVTPHYSGALRGAGRGTAPSQGGAVEGRARAAIGVGGSIGMGVCAELPPTNGERIANNRADHSRLRHVS